jgi:hypothetical protein
MRRIPAWTLTAIVLVCSATVPIIIRGAFRYHTVRKLLANFPYGEQRLSVSPKIKTLTTSTSIKPVNLGYATLDMGSTGQIYVATEGDRAVVVITNTDFEFRLSAPFAFGGPTNGVAMHIEVEETRILPISQIALMSKDNFHLYVIKLVSKAGNKWGSNEIWSFTTPHIKGIVREGEGPDDRQGALVNLASLDGTRNLMMLVFLLHGSTKDIALALDPILASFQFTIGKVSDRDEIKKLISEAGIPIRPTNQSLPSGSYPKSVQLTRSAKFALPSWCHDKGGRCIWPMGHTRCTPILARSPANPAARSCMGATPTVETLAAIFWMASRTRL